MKKKIILLLMSLLILCGCSSGSLKVNGEKVSFRGKAKYFDLEFSTPEKFERVESKNESNDTVVDYVFTDGLYQIKMSRIYIMFSQEPLYEDVRKLEDEVGMELVPVEYKGRKTKFAKYEYTLDNKENHTYYCFYSHAGVSYYYKITFVNTAGNEAFEKAFLDTVKV